MSSTEDDHVETHESSTPGPPQVKKRRVQTLRACDRCRLKKIRCDGVPGSNQKCSHCALSESTCVFTEGTKKRAPPKKYVDGLESRLERLEALLTRLHPDSDFSHELDGDLPSSPVPMSPEDSHNAPKPRASSSSAHSSTHFPTLPHLLDDPHDDLTNSPEVYETEDDEEFSNPGDVTRQFRALDLKPGLNRFYGKSSSVRLFRRALSLKSEVSGVHYDLAEQFTNSPYKRPDFWQIHPWERSRFVQESNPSYTFPEPDLMAQLIENFFYLGNAVCPLFHRPTFEQQVADGLHLVDEGFGGVVSLVCALGARGSDDPRVFLDDPVKPNHPHSAGWRWFNQVQLVRNIALAYPTLHDLQICALAVVFMHGSSPPQACWTLIGIGLRMAQDVGAHRRHAYLDKPMAEAELWKRAFWVLFTLDIWMSSFLGRTCALPLDSIDLDFPIECDDEYWFPSDPEQAFKQPPGKPSMMSYYISWIKLHTIHAHALRTIYSLEKQKIIAQIGRPEWEVRVVTELDSALNRWFDSLPDHLRWDPTRENELHFFQSACLHAAYYLVQMTIHRPFIPSSRKESSLSFPSLAICCNSARSCSHVVEVERQRMPGLATSNLLLPAFMSGIVLLLGIWGAKRSGLVLDAAKQMQDVYNCMRFLGSGENRWPIAGRLRDLLRNLSAVGELPLPESPPSHKRERDGEEDNEGPSANTNTNTNASAYTASASNTNGASTSKSNTTSTSNTTSISTTTTTSTSTPTSNFPPSSGLAPAAHRKIAGRKRHSQDSSEISTFGPPLSAEDKLRLEAETAAKVYASRKPSASSGSSMRASVPPSSSVHASVPPSSSVRAHASSASASSSGTARKSGPSTPSMPVYGPGGMPVPSHAAQINGGAQYGARHTAAGDVNMTAGVGAGAFDMANGMGTQYYGPGAVYGGLGSDVGMGMGVERVEGGVGGQGGGQGIGNGLGANIDVEADELMNFFAGMVPQDGQMGVDSDMMAMWSTLPDSFQAEDWDTYVSNLIGMTGQGGTEDVGQGTRMPPSAHHNGGQMHPGANGYARPHGSAY